MRSYRLSLALVAAALFVVAAPAAQAQTPAGGGYDETDVISTLPGGGDGDVASEVAGGGGGDGDDTTPTTTRTESGSGTPATQSGSLPFTGADVGLMALMGLALLGTGLVLRRTRRSES